MTDQPSDVGGLSFCRVVVVGANGAGKTRFADQLAQEMDAPVICKDALALTTRWQQRSPVAIRSAILARIVSDRWVLEGGPSILLPEVLARAHLVIWLDIGAGLRFWRIVRRSLLYLGRTRPEHPLGNRDWPGVRQWRFAWRALVNGAVTDRIDHALRQSSVRVTRLQGRAAVVQWRAGRRSDRG